jgi:hypothetical protein
MRNFITFTVIFALGGSAFAQSAPTLAIAEVTSRGNADADDASGMADALTEALVADGRVRVVERQQIAKVMKEQALSQAGVISDEVQIKVAQLVGARWIVLGTIGTKGKGYVLSLRALDSSSAQVAFADSVKVGTDEQIEAGSRQLARKLTGKLLGGTAQASNEVVGDFDPAQISDGAKAVARSLALRFPKLTGRIVNVIPNGTASCTFSEAKPFKGEFFQISGADEVTGQDTSKGYFLLSSYSQNGCSGRIKREGFANVNDGDLLTSMPIKIGVEAVEAGPGTQPELAKLVADEIRAALDTFPQFQVAADPQVTATGRVVGGRGNRTVAMQVVDKGGNVVGKVDVPVPF